MVERAGVRHTQLTTRYQGHDIEVDVHIAPLLHAMWDHGYETFGSCENIRAEMAVIWFNKDDQAAADRFCAEASPYWTSDLSSPTRPCIGFLSRDIEAITDLFSG